MISSVVVSYTYSSFAREAVDYANQPRRAALVRLERLRLDGPHRRDALRPRPPRELPDPGRGRARTPDTFRARSNVTSYGTHNVFSRRGEQHLGRDAVPGRACWRWCSRAALNARDEGTIPRRLTPGRGQAGDDGHRERRGPADAVAERAGPVARQPGQRDRRHPHELVHPVRLRAAQHRRRDRADHVRARSRRPPSSAHRTGTRTSTRRRQRYLPIRGARRPERLGLEGRSTGRWSAALGANPDDTRLPHDLDGQRAAKAAARHARPETDPAQYAVKTPGSTLPPDGPEQYTVTLRLRAHDGDGLKAEDRRTFNARHDPDLLPSYPKDIGTEMSAAPTYADLDGQARARPRLRHLRRDVHALRPDGSEVPGFPIHTRTLASIDPNEPRELSGRVLPERRQASRRARPGQRHRRRRPRPRRGLDVVATTAQRLGLRLGAERQAAQGLPCPLPVDQFASLPVPTPRSASDHSRLPSRGNWSPPVLADLHGRREAGHPHVRASTGSSTRGGRTVARCPGGRFRSSCPPADLVGAGPNDYIRRRKAHLAAGGRRRPRHGQASGIRPRATSA